MANLRWVFITYFVLAVLTGLFLEHVFQIVLGAAGVNDPQFFGDAWSASGIAGFVVAFGIAAYAWLRRDIRDLAADVVAELRKVSWPTMAETRAATVAVVVTTFIIAAVLGLFDLAWAEVTKLIYEAPRYLG